ncbi:DUF4097 family beta strand repeat-containing protein [Actinophytocola sp.]|uniref:DUF4097 family beta strand repeat-containing protein n=1 Tax=Actinophytocola sp. TaxID=1872138 RepID=UPI002D8004F9|nr:DUF4097 family beta strand repeat-containing protein [Actinophytocola sp.]HET9144276.1 DUF4097 family beta strand repeat-containing protein [Actinophytocola sp.]
MRRLVIAGLGAGLLMLGACGWAMGRNSFDDGARVDERISSIRVANDAGDVIVRAGETTTVHRKVHYDREQPGATHRVEGDVLVIESCPARNCWIDYEITVPAGTRLDGVLHSGRIEAEGLAAVNLKVDSGDVTLRRVAGAVNLQADSGQVTLVDIGAAVAVKSDSGDVTVNGAKAAVTIVAESGNVVAGGVGGAVDVRSSSGDLTLGLVSAQNVRARADSGAVAVTVPRGAYRVRAETDSGTVNSDVADDPAGGHQLDLHSDNGDITLQYS